MSTQMRKKKWLRRAATESSLNIGLVSAYAGDRKMTKDEQSMFSKRIEDRGDYFYSDLLYSVTHQCFPCHLSEELWNKVITHKRSLSEKLNRNVSLTVSALDYLSNVTCKIKDPILINEDYYNEIANYSMRDGMTGLFNHASFYELLEMELRNNRRYGGTLALILIDIDDFKAVNDHYGHQNGDKVLMSVAQNIVKQSRESDICCRFGGDEFVVIMPLTIDGEEVIEIAERIRSGATKISCGRHQITISVGIALSGYTASSPRALVEKADQALYESKLSGKNRVDFALVP